jgi:HEPN domain-containing protein
MCTAGICGKLLFTVLFYFPAFGREVSFGCALRGGERFVTGHSIFKLLGTLQQKVSGDIIEKAKVLDQFYIAARYPNGLPGGAPYEVFTQSQANEALEHAQQVYTWAHNELKG